MVNSYNSIEYLFVGDCKAYGHAYKKLAHKYMHIHKFVFVCICEYMRIFVQVYITFSNAKKMYFNSICITLDKF